jgi:hypothetical protein
MKKSIWFLIIILGLPIMLSGCGNPTAAQRERQQQEVISQQAISQVGMPAVKNFREKKMLKDIIELRDQQGLTTYTYIVDMNGRLHFLGETVGYGIPYATQYTNPNMPDPNGLYSPASAEGTWILMKDPNGKDVKPVYVEPRIIVSPFKLNTG